MSIDYKDIENLEDNKDGTALNQEGSMNLMTFRAKLDHTEKIIEEHEIFDQVLKIKESAGKFSQGEGEL
jgi:hypothetical protein